MGTDFFHETPINMNAILLSFSSNSFFNCSLTLKCPAKSYIENTYMVSL